MATNKRLGEEVATSPAFLHRLAWLRKDHAPKDAHTEHVIEAGLRERVA
jgi:hypothetical protein